MKPILIKPNTKAYKVMGSAKALVSGTLGCLATVVIIATPVVVFTAFWVGVVYIGVTLARG